MCFVGCKLLAQSPDQPEGQTQDLGIVQDMALTVQQHHPESMTSCLLACWWQEAGEILISLYGAAC